MGWCYLTQEIAISPKAMYLNVLYRYCERVMLVLWSAGDPISIPKSREMGGEETWYRQHSSHWLLGIDSGSIGETQMSRSSWITALGQKNDPDVMDQARLRLWWLHSEKTKLGKRGSNRVNMRSRRHSLQPCTWPQLGQAQPAHHTTKYLQGDRATLERVHCGIVVMVKWFKQTMVGRIIIYLIYFLLTIFRIQAFGIQR